MNRTLCCGWLPNRARWSYMYLACSGLPAVSCKKNFPESHITNPLLTKLVQSRWLDIGLILFFARSINTQKKELGQYPPILTSHLSNNPYINVSFFPKSLAKASPSDLIGKSNDPMPANSNASENAYHPFVQDE